MARCFGRAPAGQVVAGQAFDGLPAQCGPLRLHQPVPIAGRALRLGAVAPNREGIAPAPGPRHRPGRKAISGAAGGLQVVALPA